MADVVRIIGEAFEIYRRDWRKVVAPFVVLFAIACIFQLFIALFRLSPQLVCGNTNNAYALVALCYFPQIAIAVLGVAEELLSVIIVMAALMPLYGMVNRKKVAGWVDELGAQFVNSVKIIVFRIALNILIALPIAVFIILNIGIIVAAGQSGQGMLGLAAMGGIALLVLILFMVVLLAMIVSFLLTFIEIEMAVGGKGLLAAIGASYHCVMSNFFDVLAFNIIWWVIGILAGIVSVAMCCTIVLIPLMLILVPLIIRPVQWTSKVMLWQALGGKKAK